MMGRYYWFDNLIFMQRRVDSRKYVLYYRTSLIISFDHFPNVDPTSTYFIAWLFIMFAQRPLAQTLLQSPIFCNLARLEREQSL